MSEPILCFNGKECSYNDDVKCIHYEGTAESGGCQADYLKGGVAPVAQPTTRTVSPPPPPEEVREHAATHVPGVRQINTLREGETGNKANPITIKGTLVFDPIQKDVDTRSGPNTVTSIVIKDDSGEAKVSFWGDSGNQMMDFVKGDKLFLEGLYKVKAPYDGKPQVDGGKYYKVAKLN